MTPERSKSRSKAIEPPHFLINDEELRLVDMALAEDRGAGDWTTRWIVPARTAGHAHIIAHAEGVVAGLAVASAVFMRLDPRVEVDTALNDGGSVAEGDVVCSIKGPARAILTGERTALNFLQRLCGVATQTRKFVDAVAGTDATILDTRMTTPGWRSLEKAAVRAGGGQNNRLGLYDMVVIKQGHARIAGGLTEAIKRVRESNTTALKVKVEVRDKEELRAALDAGCDVILLADLDVQGIRECVRVIKQRAPAVKSEAAGHMTLERVRAVAETGVDYISVAALTQAGALLDLSLDLA